MENYRRRGLKGRIRLNASRKRPGRKRGQIVSSRKSNESTLPHQNVSKTHGESNDEFLSESECITPLDIVNENITPLHLGEGSNSLLNTPKRVPNQNEKFAKLEGRRLVDIQYFLDCLKNLNNHDPRFGCTLSNMNVVKEIRDGYVSTLKLKCEMCEGTYDLQTTTTDPNQDAVLGVMMMGAGYTALAQLSTCIEVPFPSRKTYQTKENALREAFQTISLESMNEAGEKEKKLAIEAGDLSPDGIPMITVVADGCWAKRSYKTNYNSLSGAAAIIGCRTKQVLFIGIKNKYCTICQLSKNREEVVPKIHKCFKNFEGSSTSMEGDILKEGFLYSLEQHGLIYNKLIADGDSNSLKQILDAHPYQNVIVRKIECRNHLLRNYSRKIRDLAKDANAGPLVLRRLISKEQLRLRYAVTKAIDYRKKECGSINEKVKLLKLDIENSISHIFGEHKLCAKLGYFCREQYKPNGSILSDLKMTGLYDKLFSFVNYLSRNATSLIHDVDNNVSEQFNSIIAKFIGGKRINYCQRGSYHARCLASVISHNTRRPIYTIKRFLDEKSPIGLVKRGELRKKYPKRKRIFHAKENAGPDSSYGDKCQKPDLTPEEFEKAKEEFLETLKKNIDDIKLIEELTREQSDSDLWHLERRKRLTASNYGAICAKFSKRSNGDTKKLVEQLLYPKTIHSDSIEWGMQNEKRAINALEKLIDEKIAPCGLFISENAPFLEATPDGLIGERGIVEIKCPFSSKNMIPDTKKKNNFLEEKWRSQSKSQMVLPNTRPAISNWKKLLLLCGLDAFWHKEGNHIKK